MVRSALLETAVALRGWLRSRHQIAAALMSEVAFADGSTDRSLTRKSFAITEVFSPRANRSPASRRTPSRKARRSAVRPPPCAYRIQPA